MNKIPIIGYNIAKNKYHSFESITHAANHCKTDISSVSAVLNNTFKKSKGWCFVYESKDFQSEIADKLKEKCKRGLYASKKVFVTDNYGGSETYDSVAEAAELLGLSKTTISQCAMGKRKSPNFKFKYV